MCVGACVLIREYVNVLECSGSMDEREREREGNIFKRFFPLAKVFHRNEIMEFLKKNSFAAKSLEINFREK